MRLDKILAQEKVSRKGMKQALLKKEILVDGLPAYSLAQNVDTGLQELIFKDRIIEGYEHIYLMLHKPNGVVTASKDKELLTVMTYYLNISSQTNSMQLVDWIEIRRVFFS